MSYYTWYSEKKTGRGRSPLRPLLAVSNVTAHASTASIPFLLLDNSPLLCGSNVPSKGLIPSTQAYFFVPKCLYCTEQNWLSESNQPHMLAHQWQIKGFMNQIGDCIYLSKYALSSIIYHRQSISSSAFALLVSANWTSHKVKLTS